MKSCLAASHLINSPELQMSPMSPPEGSLVSLWSLRTWHMVASSTMPLSVCNPGLQSDLELHAPCFTPASGVISGLNFLFFSFFFCIFFSGTTFAGRAHKQTRLLLENAFDLHGAATLKGNIKKKKMACRSLAYLFPLCWWRIAAAGQELTARQRSLATFRGVNPIRELLCVSLSRGGHGSPQPDLAWAQLGCPKLPLQLQGGKENGGKSNGRAGRAPRLLLFWASA